MFVPRVLSQLVDRVARQSIGKDWTLYATLLDHWTEIVGAQYAESTTPSKITFPHQPLERQRRGGTLYVRLPRGLTMEFTYKAQQIKQRINTYFGCDVIDKIAFEPVYGLENLEIAKVVGAPSMEAVSSIRDNTQSVASEASEDLRDALQSFGLALIGASNDDVQETNKRMDSETSKC